MPRFKKFMGGMELGANGYFKNFVVESLSADPSAPDAGRVWFNNADKVYKACITPQTTDTNGNVIPAEIRTFGTAEELQAFISLLSSQTVNEGSALIGFSGHTGANNKFNLPANDLESTLKSVVDGIDADRKVIEDNLAAANASIADVQAELDATQTGAGLGTDGSYTANAATNYISGATSIVDATEKLDAQAKTNADAITQEVSDRTAADTALQAYIDDNFLNKTTTTEQVVNAKVTMNSDLYVKGNITFNGGTITEIVTEQLKVGDNIVTLNSDVPAGTAPTENAGLEVNRGTEGVMPLIIWDETDDTAKVVSGKDANGNWILLPIATGGDAAALQAEVDTVESSVGLGTDGSYVAPANTNYTGNATTVIGAVSDLDGALKSEETARIAADNTLQSNIDGVQAELDATQTGAGLGTDGSYTADANSNYITGATSLYNADQLLDAQIKANADAIAQTGSASAAGDQAIKDAINATRFTFQSSSAATSFTVAHNLGSEFVDVMVWVLDTTDGKYYNDDTVVSIVDANNVQVDLTAAADIRVTVVNVEATI